MTMTTTSSSLLFATILVALMQIGCGGASAPESAMMEQGTAGSEEPAAGGMVDNNTTVGVSAGEEWQNLVVEDDYLSQTLELSEVDCPSARDLVQSICSLAERVCAIAEDTADGETEERCVDGRSRCERAHDRTSNRCP